MNDVLFILEERLFIAFGEPCHNVPW